nr:MAG TPA: hypothetical protein [Caudoviricetes sp.]
MTHLLPVPVWRRQRIQYITVQSIPLCGLTQSNSTRLKCGEK